MSGKPRTIPGLSLVDKPAATCAATGGLRVEILGMPGVGKTYLLKRLRGLGRAGVSHLGYKESVGALKHRERLARYHLGLVADLLPAGMARRVARRAYQERMRELETHALVSFAERYQDLAAWLLDAVGGAAVPVGDRMLMMHWFQRLFTDYQLATRWHAVGRGEPAFLMLDEAFAQKAVSLALLMGFPPAMVSEYVARVPLPELLAVIDASDEAIYGRLERRGWPGWVAPSDEEGKRRFMSISRETVATTARALAARDVPILTISNEGSGEEVARRMASLLRAHVERCRAAG